MKIKKSLLFAFMSWMKNGSHGIILPKDLKESRAEYQARKEDDQRRFNGQSKRWQV